MLPKKKKKKKNTPVIFKYLIGGNSHQSGKHAAIILSNNINIKKILYKFGKNRLQQFSFNLEQIFKLSKCVRLLFAIIFFLSLSFSFSPTNKSTLTLSFAAPAQFSETKVHSISNNSLIEMNRLTNIPFNQYLNKYIVVAEFPTASTVTECLYVDMFVCVCSRLMITNTRMCLVSTLTL